MSALIKEGRMRVAAAENEVAAAKRELRAALHSSVSKLEKDIRVAVFKLVTNFSDKTDTQVTCVDIDFIDVSLINESEFIMGEVTVSVLD